MNMNIPLVAQRLYNVGIHRLLLVLSIFIVVLVVFQCFSLPLGRGHSSFTADTISVAQPVEIATTASTTLGNLELSHLAQSPVVPVLFNVTHASASKEEAAYWNGAKETDNDYGLKLDSNSYTNDGFTLEEIEILGRNLKLENERGKEMDKSYRVSNHFEMSQSSHTQIHSGNVPFESHIKSADGTKKSNCNIDSLRTPYPLITDRTSSVASGQEIPEMQPKDQNVKHVQATSAIIYNESTLVVASTLKKLETLPTSITHINSLLLQSSRSSQSMRPRWSSARDREILFAKLEIEKAPVLRNITGLYDVIFRNVSMFKRSYDLMESILKVYIYREGEKPIFHQPKMRGIYASEGWFMKQMEGNKKFVVKDPRKAHLFYLPFSSKVLRVTLSGNNSHFKDLNQYLKQYVELIARKYRFWNRTGGADHFLVACHDWALKVTRQPMENCIQALCNANFIRGFKVGKDTTLPVTYIRSLENMVRDIGGKHPSERNTLAFFAGSLHGYLRPILLQYWENKEPDMKISGPMPRDIEGKRIYMEYMKSSKYCICARGYEVHTPRVVESILYECVPVIISDDYVPPFFEVLNWEAFSVFIQERDIPNLREILLSIPEEKYLELQLGVRMVQQHFLWHKIPVAYDVFHMILHSVWYNRVFQMKLL